jgi:hypothetical protein
MPAGPLSPDQHMQYAPADQVTGQRSMLLRNTAAPSATRSLLTWAAPRLANRLANRPHCVFTAASRPTWPARPQLSLKLICQPYAVLASVNRRVLMPMPTDGRSALLASPKRWLISRVAATFLALNTSPRNASEPAPSVSIVGPCRCAQAGDVGGLGVDLAVEDAQFDAVEGFAVLAQRAAGQR